MFNMQHMLVIDGKYSSDDGLSTKVMISGAVIIREEKQPCSLDLIQKSRQPSYRTGAARGLPSGKSKVKSRQNEGRQIWI